MGKASVAFGHAATNPILPEAPASGQEGTTMKENIMGSLVMLVIIGLCIGWIVWKRQLRRYTDIAPVTPEAIPRDTLALHAFSRGNTCMAEGKFAEAIAAFHEARELNPKRAHVDARLAEAERRQREASTPPSITSLG
jgi:tetratricopeptide (TPR) repeat protein